MSGPEGVGLEGPYIAKRDRRCIRIGCGHLESLHGFDSCGASGCECRRFIDPNL